MFFVGLLGRVVVMISDFCVITMFQARLAVGAKFVGLLLVLTQ